MLPKQRTKGNTPESLLVPPSWPWCAHPPQWNTTPQVSFSHWPPQSPQFLFWSTHSLRYIFPASLHQFCDLVLSTRPWLRAEPSWHCPVSALGWPHPRALPLPAPRAQPLVSGPGKDLELREQFQVPRLVPVLLHLHQCLRFLGRVLKHLRAFWSQPVGFPCFPLRRTRPLSAGASCVEGWPFRRCNASWMGRRCRAISGNSEGTSSIQSRAHNSAWTLFLKKSQGFCCGT